MGLVGALWVNLSTYVKIKAKGIPVAIIITPRQVWSSLILVDKIDLLKIMSRDRELFNQEEQDTLTNLSEAIEVRSLQKLPHLTEEMKDLIKKGCTIDAIKLYRDSYLPQPSLRLARDVVRIYRDGLDSGL